MVAPTPKSPRYQLAAHERQLYREALQKKATRKKAANLTTPAIEIPRSKKKTSPAESKETATAREAAVAEVVADMVTSVVIAATPARPDAVARPATSGSTRKWKRRPTRPRRRAVLQEDDEDGLCMLKVLSDEAERDVRGDTMLETPACIIDADPNLVAQGPDQCTCLNSDEDSDICEESQDEEDEDGDSGDGDWDIGYLTDEDSDEELMEIPDSMWPSAAKNAERITSMRHNGWEYDQSKFGPDPSYADLFRWGTKVFVAACAKTAYCVRVQD
ncbi:hypothetical protein PC123_g17018 [Phytophthora cactorum]|nr:hypothetical protein PC123_g17018 [Phytophthora cactorum]